MRQLVLAVFVGVAISAVMSAVDYALMPAQGIVWPAWYGPFRTLSEAFLTVGPGVVAGWMAGRKGWLVGAAVGGCVTLLSLAILPFVWGPISPSIVFKTLIFGGMATVLTHSVAGAAGELLKTRAAP